MSGNELLAMTECVQFRNHGLYMDRRLHNPREIEAEMRAVQLADKKMVREFGDDGRGVVLAMLNDKIKHASYYIRPEDGKAFRSMEEVGRLFREADEKARSKRFWYEARCNEPDLVFQVLETRNPPMDKAWDKVFDELAGCRTFEESVNKLFALGCIVYPEDAEELGISMDEEDIRGMFDSHIPETFVSIRSRVLAGNDPDLPREYVPEGQAESAAIAAEDMAEERGPEEPVLREPVLKRQFPAWNYDVKKAAEHGIRGPAPEAQDGYGL